jgi:FdhD protein
MARKILTGDEELDAGEVATATPPAQGRSLQLTQVVEWHSGEAQTVSDALAAEEPLEIRVNGAPLTVTMRTPGDDLELAAGFLLTEGIVEEASEIESLAAYVSSAGGKSNGVEATIADYEAEGPHGQRNFFAASSCGICGKASIEAIRRRGLRAPNAGFRMSAAMLCTLPDRLREAQAVFSQTGGLHAAALFDAMGELKVVREDIGRHNAVDKVIGWAMQRGMLPLADHVLLVSGRGGFEIVQKTLAGGLPVLASVSAPSSLAVQLARELGLTLVGFLRGERFVVYAGAERLQF